MKAELDGEALVVDKIAQIGGQVPSARTGLLASLKYFEEVAIRDCRKVCSRSRKAFIYLWNRMASLS